MSQTTSITISVQLNSGLDCYVLKIFLVLVMVEDILLDFECINKWIYFSLTSITYYNVSITLNYSVSLLKQLYPQRTKPLSVK